MEDIYSSNRSVCTHTQTEADLSQCLALEEQHTSETHLVHFETELWLDGSSDGNDGARESKCHRRAAQTSDHPNVKNHLDRKSAKIFPLVNYVFFYFLYILT